MHILAPTFLNPLIAKNIPIINLHPALPGKYDGAKAVRNIRSKITYFGLFSCVNMEKYTCSQDMEALE